MEVKPSGQESPTEVAQIYVSDLLNGGIIDSRTLGAQRRASRIRGGIFDALNEAPNSIKLKTKI